MNKRYTIHKNIYFYLTILLLIAFPIYVKILSLITLLLFLNFLVEGKFREKFSVLFSEKGPSRIMFVLMLLFYAMHAIALFNTNNMKAGTFEMEEKLSFLVFPLILLPIYSYRFKKEKIKYFFLAYVLSAFAGSVFCILQSLIKYSTTNDIQSFYYLNFSVIQHPTYYAMYLITAIILVLAVLFKQWNSLKIIFKIILIASIPYFLLIIMLSNSRSGIIVATFILLIAIFYIIFRKRKLLLGFALVVFLAVSGYTITRVMPQVFDRFYSIKEVIEADKMEDITHWNGTTLRIQIFYSAEEIIEENFWLGVSPGDTRDELVKKYKKYGFRHAIDRNYEAHNQFVQSFIGLGVFGLIVLLLIFLVPFIYAIKNKDFILFCFSIMIFLLCMFESMLQKQAGVMFIVFSILFLTARDRIFSSLKE
jgi:O-antigen ligase